MTPGFNINIWDALNILVTIGCLWTQRGPCKDPGGAKTLWGPWCGPVRTLMGSWGPREGDPGGVDLVRTLWGPLTCGGTGHKATLGQRWQISHTPSNCLKMTYSQTKMTYSAPDILNLILLISLGTNQCKPLPDIFLTSKCWREKWHKITEHQNAPTPPPPSGSPLLPLVNQYMKEVFVSNLSPPLPLHIKGGWLEIISI